MVQDVKIFCCFYVHLFCYFIFIYIIRDFGSLSIFLLHVSFFFIAILFPFYLAKVTHRSHGINTYACGSSKSCRHPKNSCESTDSAIENRKRENNQFLQNSKQKNSINAYGTKLIYYSINCIRRFWFCFVSIHLPTCNSINVQFSFALLSIIFFVEQKRRKPVIKQHRQQQQK